MDFASPEDDRIPSDTSLKSDQILPVWLAVLGILLTVALLYAPVVTNAFNGDDFVHLKWLHQAMSQPELIWRNFYSPWLDITTAKFYRPLISIFMVADYLFWRNNGIGFHVTNVLCHLGNTYLLWLVLEQLSTSAAQIESKKKGENGSIPDNHLWCLGAAALFGLYPLHPEAVSWITGRVDTFVTLFSLLTLSCYIRWRQLNKKKWLFFSMGAFVCGLLSKEMAIVLPAVILSYEIIWFNLISACKRSFPFWIVLVLYFLLRYYALGTFIGGYGNASLTSVDWHWLIKTWFLSTYMLLFPFNETLIGPDTFFILIWALFLLISLLLGARRIAAGRKEVAICTFLVVWLVLDLVPIYRIFNISGDLEGSRLVYLATAPLCALLCFGFGLSESIKAKHYFKAVVLITMLSAAGAGLLVNNSAWIKAQASSRAILEEVDALSKERTDNAVIYIVGLPDQVNGAYVCRNALDGMTKYPQSSKDMTNCFNLNEINNVFPFGYARAGMVHPQSGEQSARFYVWHSAEEELQRYYLPKETIDSKLKANGASFTDRRKLSAEEVDIEEIVDQLNRHSAHTEMFLNLHGRDCFNIDCLAVEVQLSPHDASTPCVLNLFYSNDLCPEFSEDQRLEWSSAGRSGKLKVLFPLHGQVNWAMGGKCRGLKLIFPESGLCKIKRVALEPLNKVMPILFYKANANQSNLGFIELDKKHSFCQVNYDAREMEGVEAVKLECTQPNQTFAVANDFRAAPTNSLKELSGLSGTLTLTLADFIEPGIYELRLRAFDKNNQALGVAGDHIVVTVK